MRKFFEPAAGPFWLRQVLASIRSALGDIWDVPVRLAQFATADRPPAANYKSGLIYDTDDDLPAFSDGTDWFELAAYDADVAAYAALSTTGLVTRTGAGTVATRTITGPAAGITVSNGDGVAGNPTLGLANDLAALEALSGTSTIYYRSGADTWSAVTIGGNLGFSGGTLGSSLGTAATKDTGTSGGTIPLLNGTNTWAAAQTFSVDGSFTGRAIGTGGQTNSTVLGGTVTSTASVAVGASASCTGASALALGRSATAAASGIAFGESSNGNIGIAIGRDATNASGGTFNAVVIGRGATSTANAQIVIGSSTVTYSVMIIGKGVTEASPGISTYTMTGGSGTDIAGGTLRIDGSAGTGSGTPGTILLRTSTAGASSSTLQTQATRVTVSEAGLDVVGLSRCDTFRIDQSPTAETPAATHTITISANGTNYKLLCVAA